MKKKKVPIFQIAILLVVVTANAAAQPLDVLFAAATKHDLTLQKLKLSLDARLTDVEISEARDGFSMSLSGAGGGLPLFSYSSSGGYSIKFGPSMSGNIGTAFGTTYSLSVPLSYSDRGFEMLVSAGVSQPLNEIFGWAPTTVADMETASGIAKAETDIIARTIAVEKEVLGALRSLYSLEAQEFDLEGAITDLQEELQNQRTLFQFNEKSYKFRKLEFDLIEKRDELKAVQANADRQTKLLSEKLGGMEVSLPIELPDTSINIPSVSDSSANAAVVSAARALAIAEEKVRVHVLSTKPALSLSSSVGADPGNLADSWSISLSLGVKMDLFDGDVSDLELQKLSNAAEQARITLEDALHDYENDVLDLGLEADDFATREQRFPLEVELAELKLAETRVSYDNGFISGSDLSVAERERAKIEFDRSLLFIDKQLLVRDAANLTVLKD